MAAAAKAVLIDALPVVGSHDRRGVTTAVVAAFSARAAMVGQSNGGCFGTVEGHRKEVYGHSPGLYR